MVEMSLHLIRLNMSFPNAYMLACSHNCTTAQLVVYSRIHISVICVNILQKYFLTLCTLGNKITLTENENNNWDHVKSCHEILRF